MRPRRKVEFERIMLRKAWRADELATLLGMHVTSCRRYLRRYYNAGILDRVKDGVSWYYVVARFLQPPDGVTTCECGSPAEIFHRKCGCVFFICTGNESHSRFNYCQRHSAVKLKGGESLERGDKSKDCTVGSKSRQTS